MPKPIAKEKTFVKEQPRIEKTVIKQKPVIAKPVYVEKTDFHVGYKIEKNIDKVVENEARDFLEFFQRQEPVIVEKKPVEKIEEKKDAPAIVNTDILEKNKAGLEKEHHINFLHMPHFKEHEKEAQNRELTNKPAGHEHHFNIPHLPHMKEHKEANKLEMNKPTEHEHHFSILHHDKKENEPVINQAMKKEILKREAKPMIKNVIRQELRAETIPAVSQKTMPQVHVDFKYVNEADTNKVAEITTKIDDLYNLVMNTKILRIEQASETIGVAEPEIEKWARILEENKLIEIFYPAFGKIKLLAPVTKKEKVKKWEKQSKNTK